MASPYLEPIDESDLDTKQQFTGGNEALKKEATDGASREQPSVPVKKEKEVSQEVVRAEKDASYNKILSKVKTQLQTQSTEDDVKMDALSASEKIDLESRITKLVDLAMNKGVAHAVKVAKHLEDNYVIDMLHDKLMADELHDALLKKGLIRES